MDKKSGGDRPDGMFLHAPVPYYVRLRAAADDDAPTSVVEFRLEAYSVYEAAMQAILQAGSVVVEESNYKIEHIGPDVDAYLKKVLEAVAGKSGAKC